MSGDFFRGFGKTRQLAKLQRRATMRAADDAAFLAASGVGQLGVGQLQVTLHFFAVGNVKKGFQEMLFAVVIHPRDTL